MNYCCNLDNFELHKNQFNLPRCFLVQSLNCCFQFSSKEEVLNMRRQVNKTHNNNFTSVTFQNYLKKIKINNSFLA